MVAEPIAEEAVLNAAFDIWPRLYSPTSKLIVTTPNRTAYSIETAAAGLVRRSRKPGVRATRFVFIGVSISGRLAIRIFWEIRATFDLTIKG